MHGVDPPESLPPCLGFQTQLARFLVKPIKVHAMVRCTFLETRQKSRTSLLRMGTCKDGFSGPRSTTHQIVNGALMKCLSTVASAP